MEWNGMELLGLSASLLAGGTAGSPQLLPGPGQTLSYMSNEPSLGALTSLCHFPFTGGLCNANICYLLSYCWAMKVKRCIPRGHFELVISRLKSSP